MNIWLITTGSSDVQIKDNHLWNDWYPEIKKSLHGIDRKRFAPTRTIDDDGMPYRMPARVLGLVYAALGDLVMQQLEFPLLREFQRQLEHQQGAIDQIILLISDQSAVFDEDERESYHCPYWQDTCLLYPILEAQLKPQFPTAQIISLLLKPASAQEGLDNWNQGLTLVQQQISAVTVEPETVYVSHQAGTPAISSAVQFSSLARFGDRVRFLVSSEQNTKSLEILPSSSYLKGIRRQEAKKLLERHDYSGVQDLIYPYLDDQKHQETKILLEAAIQWNFAKFDEFAYELQKLSDQSLAQDVKVRSQHWWWIAYESGYLALVRLHQGNAVEAFFHSFRCVEGLISKWAEVTYPMHVEPNNDSPQVKLSILEILPNYLGNKKQEHLLSEFKERQKLGLHSFPLYDLLRKGKPDWKQTCKDLTVFTDQIASKRNKLFHRLKGLESVDVFQEWKVADATGLELRILNYLNLVSEQSFPLLKEASLMGKVHQKLVSAIAQL